MEFTLLSDRLQTDQVSIIGQKTLPKELIKTILKITD